MSADTDVKPTWYLMPGGEDWKGHVAAAAIKDDVETSLRRRGCRAIFNAHDSASVWVDFGGMAMGREPTTSVLVDDLKLEMVVHHAGEFLREIRRALKDIRQGRMEWVKLHTWHWCVCLTLEQAIRLEESMPLIVAAANRSWDVFSDQLLADIASKKKG